MTYFDQIDPINDIFDQSYENKPDWKNFYKYYQDGSRLLEINFDYRLRIDSVQNQFRIKYS